jgi:hypothetical protein
VHLSSKEVIIVANGQTQISYVNLPTFSNFGGAYAKSHFKNANTLAPGGYLRTSGSLPPTSSLIILVYNRIYGE